MHERALVHDDERALELAHVLGVDAEIGLERHVDVHTLGHVDERPARPHCRVEGGELVVGRGNHGAEVLLEQLLVVAEPMVGGQEDDAQLLELLLDLVVDHLGVVLGTHAGEELLLRLGNPEPVEGALHVGGHVLPRLGLLGRGLDVVVNVLEVDRADVSTPGRHRLLLEDLERLEAVVAHPARLALHVRDLGHDVAVEPPAALEDRLLLVVEAVLLGVTVADAEGRGFGAHGAVTSFPSRTKS